MDYESPLIPNDGTTSVRITCSTAVRRVPAPACSSHTGVATAILARTVALTAASNSIENRRVAALRGNAAALRWHVILGDGSTVRVEARAVVRHCRSARELETGDLVDNQPDVAGRRQKDSGRGTMQFSRGSPPQQHLDYASPRTACPHIRRARSSRWRRGEATQRFPSFENSQELLDPL